MPLCLIGKLHPRFVLRNSWFTVWVTNLLSQWFGNVILKLSPSYIQSRPGSLPDHVAWPEKQAIVDSLASIADLRWPWVLPSRLQCA